MGLPKVAVAVAEEFADAFEGEGYLCLDGFDRYSELVGDFFVCEVFVAAEGEHSAAPVGEVQNRCAYQLVEFFCFEGADVGCHVGMVDGVDADGGFLLAKPVDGSVARGLEEIGFQREFYLECGAVVPEIGEYVEGQFLRRFSVVGLILDKPAEGCEICVEQPLECSLVAFADLPE